MVYFTSFIVQYIVSLLFCIYLFSLGFVKYQHRGLLYKIYQHSRSANKRRIPAIIPKIKATQLLPSDLEIRICEPAPVVGNISSLETVVINGLIREHNPLTVFEIGTFDGRTALNIAANIGKNSKVFTLDLPKDHILDTKLPLAVDDLKYIEKEESGIKYRGSPYEKKIVQLYGDSASFDFSPYESGIDLVFIDGSHSYEYTLKDTFTALKLLRNGKGIILWHDYKEFWEGAMRALNELFETDKRFKNMKHIEDTNFCILIS